MKFKKKKKICHDCREKNQIQGHNGNGGQHGIAQGVVPENLARVQPFGFGSEDVIFGKNFQHGAAHKERVFSGKDNGVGKRG